MGEPVPVPGYDKLQRQLELLTAETAVRRFRNRAAKYIMEQAETFPLSAQFVMLAIARHILHMPLMEEDGSND